MNRGCVGSAWMLDGNNDRCWWWRTDRDRRCDVQQMTIIVSIKCTHVCLIPPSIWTHKHAVCVQPQSNCQESVLLLTSSSNIWARSSLSLLEVIVESRVSTEWNRQRHTHQSEYAERNREISWIFVTTAAYVLELQDQLKWRRAAALYSRRGRRDWKLDEPDNRFNEGQAERSRGKESPLQYVSPRETLKSRQWNTHVTVQLAIADDLVEIKRRLRNRKGMADWMWTHGDRTWLQKGKKDDNVNMLLIEWFSEWLRRIPSLVEGTTTMSVFCRRINGWRTDRQTDS